MNSAVLRLVLATVSFAASAGSVASINPSDIAASSTQAETSTEHPDPALRILEQLSFPYDAPRGFAEQQFNPMLRTPVQNRGSVWIEKDNTMVMELNTPRPEQRRLRGDELALSRPRVRPGSSANPPDFSRIHHRLRLKPDNAAHLVLLAAGALLQGDTDWIAKHFTLSYAPRPETADTAQTAALVAHSNNWEVLLVPSNPALQKKLTWIRLTGAGDILSGLRADRGSSGWQQLHFFELNSPPTAEAM